jgi:hypothetical protein
VAFEGHRICDGEEPATNVLDVGPKEGYLAARLLPTNWVHGSAHPNELGHQLTRDSLEDWLPSLLVALEQVSMNPDEELPDEFKAGEARRKLTAIQTARVSTRSLVFEEDSACSSVGLPLTVNAKPAVLGSEMRYNGLEVGSTVCYTQPGGDWVESPPVDTDGSIAIPGWSREVELDFDENRFSTRQVILRRTVGKRWVVSVFQYCELDQNCADDEAEIKTWMAARIASTAGGAAVPVLLMFLGAWFLAIDVKRTLLGPHQSRDGEAT